MKVNSCTESSYLIAYAGLAFLGEMNPKKDMTKYKA